MGQWWPAAGLAALSAAVPAWDLSKEVAIIFITSTILWPKVNSKEGTQLPSLTENWIKDFLSMPWASLVAQKLKCAPAMQETWVREQDPVSPSVSLSHQEASISLLSFSIRGQTD